MDHRSFTTDGSRVSLVEIYAKRFFSVIFRKINLANQHINERVKKGQSYEDAWNDTSIELVAAAELHGRTFIVETYYNTINNLKKQTSRELGVVLQQLLELYAVYTILRSTGDVLRVRTDYSKNCF